MLSWRVVGWGVIGLQRLQWSVWGGMVGRMRVRGFGLMLLLLLLLLLQQQRITGPPLL